jgi:ribA/ribD-fused uncharacterized protein
MSNISQSSTIKFYRTAGKYGPFSNFSDHAVTFGGIGYPTAEHAFQAQKVTNNALRKKFAAAPTPKEAKEMGRNVTLRSDWESVKFDIMVAILTAKVEQHPAIADLLLSTGNSAIAEDSSTDYVWGIGKDGSGTNLLGKAWMKVRSNLVPREVIGQIIKDVIDNATT